MALIPFFFLSVDSAHHLNALFTVESNINLTNHIIKLLSNDQWERMLHSENKAFQGKHEVLSRKGVS